MENFVFFHVKLSFARYSVCMALRVNIHINIADKTKGLTLFHLTICSEKKESYI